MSIRKIHAFVFTPWVCLPKEVIFLKYSTNFRSSGYSFGRYRTYELWSYACNSKQSKTLKKSPVLSRILIFFGAYISFSCHDLCVCFKNIFHHMLLLKNKNALTKLLTECEFWHIISICKWNIYFHYIKWTSKTMKVNRQFSPAFTRGISAYDTHFFNCQF